ncbi:MAG TPA: hypothetical protein VGH32_09525, partial [Pirellulales bacterium]
MPISTTFDPYYKWLGIPRTEQPPNHYRLLGINLYESDTEVIESASDQRMDYLRTFQNGPVVDESQHLLNQIASARLCLLNPKRKLEYDNALRLQQASRIQPSVCIDQMAGFLAGPPLSPGRPSFESQGWNDVEKAPTILLPRATTPAAPQPTDGAPDAVELEELGIDAPIALFPKRARLPPAIRLFGPLLSTVLVAAGLIFLSKVRESIDAVRPIDGQPHVARIEGSSHGQPAQQPPSKGIAGVSPSSDKSAILARPRGADIPPAGNQSADDDSANPLIQRPAAPSEEMSPAPAVAPPGDSNTQPSTSSRLPAPAQKSQQASIREIHDVMREEFAAASTAGGERLLAQELEKLAAETVDDAAMRYALFSQAVEAAIRADDIRLSDTLVTRLTTLYDVDAWELRLEMFARLLEETATAEARAALVEQAMQLAERAVGEDRYDAALKFAELAVSGSALLGDKTVQDRAVACDKNIARLQAADVKANLALDRLQQQPDDPAANLIVGRFRCFDKQDWQSGLRFLVRGGDTELQKLAEQELNEPSSPAEQMKLANAWWDFAERTSTKADRLSGQSIRLHA